MALRDWISHSGGSATATVATPATLELSGAGTVATVAGVAVATHVKTIEKSPTVASAASVAVASSKKDEESIKGLIDVIEGLHPCILCGGHLFNEGNRGGYFCVECQPLPEGATSNRVVRGITPRKPKKEYIYYDPTSAPAKNKKHRPSPIALAWLREHRQALDDAGWTREELYTRRKYKQGLVWLSLWDEAFNMAYLHDDGTIEFECSIHGRDFFQTARPAAMLVMSDAQSVNPNIRRANNVSKL